MYLPAFTKMGHIFVQGQLLSHPCAQGRIWRDGEYRNICFKTVNLTLKAEFGVMVGIEILVSCSRYPELVEISGHQPRILAQPT